MSTRFTRAAIPTPLSDQFPGELQGWLNYLLNCANTLDQEAALDRLLKEGVGRIEAHGCTLANASGTLRVLDGWFQAGAGVADTEDEYFVGARMAEIKGAGNVGYIEIVEDDAPPANKPSGTFGYMSWHGDVIWFDTKQTTTSQIAALWGRWCIGKVTTDASGAVTAVESDEADVVYRVTNLSNILQRLEILEQSGGGSGGGTGSIYVGLNNWLPSDLRPTKQVFDDLTAVVAKLQREAVGDPLKETRDEGEIDILRDDWHHHLANDSYQSSTLPQRVDAAVIIPGRTGAGEKNPDGTTQPVHHTGGNWPRNPRRRRFSNL